MRVPGPTQQGENTRVTSSGGVGPGEAVSRDWGDTFARIRDRRTLIMLALGFSAGIPILLIFSTLSIWLREAGIARADVTFYSWAALGYGFKWVWAPLIDRIPLPSLGILKLGQRRAWLLVSQAAIIIALCGMALTDPSVGPVAMALWAVALGFASATQDIVIDAYRIEAANEDMQAILSAAYIAGYRVGMLVAGAGALEIAGFLDGDAADVYVYDAWRVTYLCMAGAMLIGVATSLLIPEPARREAMHGDQANGPDAVVYGISDYLRFVGLFLLAVLGFVAGYTVLGSPAAVIGDLLAPLGAFGSFVANSLRMIGTIGCGAVVFLLGVKFGIAPRALVLRGYFDPLQQFLMRYGRLAFLILALISVYRIADVVMGVIANVFYTDIGFEKEEIGRITKGFGLIMTIVGGFLGGVLTLRFGVMRILMLGAVLAAATNLLFALLALVGADIYLLTAVIAADNLSGGLASAAFVAYLSALTSIQFTAMQYAIFSSIMLLLPKLLGGYSGGMVDVMGYPGFFVMTALLGIPVLILIALVSRLAPLSR